MMLHDEHLTQALRHAPDREASPSAESRAAVLNYARQSLTVRKKSLYATMQGWWRSWHIANWQLASAGSVFAAVLVLVVFWHGQPKDSEWVDATPAQIIAVESAADATAQNITESKSDKAIESGHVEGQLQKGGLPEAASRAQSALQQGERAPSAISPAPSAVSEDKNSVSAPAKEESKAGKAALPAEPELKNSVQPGAKPILMQDADKLAASAEVGGSVAAQIQPKRSAAENDVLSKRKTILPGDAGNGSSTLLVEAIVKEGGQVVARRDIEAGVLRHLYLEGAASSQNGQPCTPSQTNASNVIDRVTGYRVEVIPGCYSSAALMKEVEIYNQTLRDWYVKSGK